MKELISHGSNSEWCVDHEGDILLSVDECIADCVYLKRADLEAMLIAITVGPGSKSGREAV